MDMLKDTHTPQVLKCHTHDISTFERFGEHVDSWGISSCIITCYERRNNSYERIQKCMSQGCCNQGEGGYRHGPNRPHLHKQKYRNRVNKIYRQQRRNMQTQGSTKELMYMEAPMLERGERYIWMSKGRQYNTSAAFQPDIKIPEFYALGDF